jgi:hypothetical protein
MEPAPTTPAAVFRTTLPVGSKLVVVFVPSVDRFGQSVDQDYWVDQVLQTLARQFRGSTGYPRGRGYWRDDSQGGALLPEHPVVAFAYAAENDLTLPALTALYETVSRMGRETRQGEIGVVVDGKYYGITDYGA